MGTIGDSLDAAEQQTVHRPVPRTTAARVRFLVRQAKGSTRAVAAQLGVSQRSVERYLKGDRRNPPTAIAQEIERLVRRAWQPRVRERARRRAATTGGITIETRARFGFASAAGSTDDPRLRRITQHLPASYAAALFDAHARGATERQLADVIARGLQEVYFKDGGRRAEGLQVELADIDYLEADYS